MSSKSRPVNSNLLKQNCFLRDILPPEDLVVSCPSFYTSLSEVTHDGGISIVEKEEEYPITPESVASYSSCDYRTDPSRAISQSVRGNNLGDICSLQDVLNMPLSSQKQLYSQLKARFSSVPSPGTSSESSSSDLSLKK